MNLPSISRDVSKPNDQPTIKQETPRTDVSKVSLRIKDIWATIQGEGPYSGQPAVFVRLKGCNLRCPLCDTDYTSGSNEQTYLSRVVEKIDTLSRMDDPLYGPRNTKKLVVITGGEPFAQDILPLCEMLIEQKGYNVQVETNGTLAPLRADRYDLMLNRMTIVCSPKTPGLSSDLIPYISAWKYVVEFGQVDEQDGLPLSALGMPYPPARPANRCPVYVQPLDSQDEKKNQMNIRCAVSSCRTYGYTLCLQVHKLANLP